MNSARSRGESGTGSHRRPKAPLREQIHEVMRFFHYSRRTEQTYWLFAFAKASAGQVFGWFVWRRKRVRAQHADDVRRGFAGVWLPNALDRKYPNAPKEWAWQWLFPLPGCDSQ